MLVGAIEVAVPQGREQVHRLRGREQAGAEDRDLALEHQRQAPQPEPGRILGEGELVVGMVQAVGPAVGADRVVDERQRPVE